MTTLTLVATTAYQQIQAQSGNLYTADSNRYIMNVPTGPDIDDLIKAGCKSLPSSVNSPSLYWKAARFYGINPSDTLAAVLTVTGKVTAYPIYIPNNITVKTFNVNVTTGQTGGVCHVGLYSDNKGVPGNLVAESGEITGLTSTAVVTATLATPVVIEAGWYWFAATFSASSTLPSVAGVTAALAGGTNGLQGGDTAAHALAIAASGSTSGVVADFTYAALPSVFPTTNYANIVNAATPAFAVGL